jgi:hypothetical protein
MTKFKTSDFNDQALLDDAALEMVAGGVKDGCIPRHTITGTVPPPSPEPRDLFAKYTLGTLNV